MANNNSIVFINQNAGYFMIDIVHAHHQYTKRSFITGSLAERNIKLDKSVSINKIIRYNRSSAVKRLFTWGWGFIQIVWLIKTRYHKADLFIVTNPPFAGLLPLFCSNHFSILVYDVYPDALVAFNIIGKNSLIARWWKKANQRIFSKAANVFTISSGMKKVLSQYAAAEKITVVPIWTDNGFLKPIPKADNPFIQEQKWQQKFLVIYSGNLGHSHDVQVLVEIATKINDPSIHFVIIGEGDKKSLLQSLIESYQLSNCTLLPWQDVSMLPYTLSAADIAVVTIGKAASTLSVPSKTFNLLSVGAPLLCIANAQSELANLVDQYKVGKCFEALEIDNMIAFIHQVKSDKNYQIQLQQNAITASKDFGPANAFKFVLN